MGGSRVDRCRCPPPTCRVDAATASAAAARHRRCRARRGPRRAAYPGTASAGDGGPPIQATVNGMAVASLVLGLFGWCFFVPGILAVIFGNLALGKIATSAGREKGRGMAIAGIVLGWISIAVLAGLTIAWLAYGLSNL